MELVSFLFQYGTSASVTEGFEAKCQERYNPSFFFCSFLLLCLLNNHFVGVFVMNR